VAVKEKESNRVRNASAGSKMYTTFRFPFQISLKKFTVVPRVYEQEMLY